MSLNKLAATKLHQEELDKRIEEVLLNITSRCSPLKVILFGSASRGEYTEYSDFDIALIFQTLTELKQGQTALFSKKPDHPYPVDYLFYTEESFLKKLNSGGVCEIIQREGQVLFSVA